MAGMPNKDLRNTRNQAAQQRLFNQTTELPVSELMPSPENGRKKLRAVESLAEALKTAGMVQAMTVVTVETYLSHYPQHEDYVRQSGKRYVVLHGHRRLAAAEMAGMEKVPVYLRKTVISPRIAAIQENEQRLGLDPVEQGADYQAAMLEENISQRELARQLGGTSQTTISHKIKLLSLIPELRQAVVNHWLKKNGLEPEGDSERWLPVKEAATILASLRPDLQQAYADGRLSLDDAETIVKSKVPLEDQQLPSAATTASSASSTTPDATASNGQGGTPENDTAATTSDTGGKEQDSASDSAGANPVPAPRAAGSPAVEESIESEGGGQPTADTAATTSAESGSNTSGTGTAHAHAGDAESEQPRGSVSTVAARGAIPLTTVKDIYTGLKENLSPEEFEELQDLILGD